MPITLIVGANRGIGLALCREFSQQQDSVIAVCRQTSAELDDLGLETIQNIDVTQSKDIQVLQQRLENRTINTLIHNAGVFYRDTLDNLNFADIETQLQVNTIAPLRMIHGLLNNLSSGSKIGILSSRMGSIANNEAGSMYGYRISKTAVNMVGTNLAIDLAPKNIAIALIHPGYVTTDMTDYQGNVSPEYSAQNIVKIMNSVNIENSGTFWHVKGHKILW